MKTRMRNFLNDFRMSRFMIALLILGVVLIPTLWAMGYEIIAIVVMLTVFTMLVQAACIDLPGSPYKSIHRLWKHKTDRKGQGPTEG
jgi:hypothetical protein